MRVLVVEVGRQPAVHRIEPAVGALGRLDAGCAGADEDADPAGSETVDSGGDRPVEAVGDEGEAGEAVVAAVEGGELTFNRFVFDAFDTADPGADIGIAEVAAPQAASPAAKSGERRLRAAAEGIDGGKGADRQGLLAGNLAVVLMSARRRAGDPNHRFHLDVAVEPLPPAER